MFIPPIHSWNKDNFRVLLPDLPYPFLIKPIQKIVNQLLLFGNLYQQVKNPGISLIVSRDIVDSKILQFDWLKVFCPIS